MSRPEIRNYLNNAGVELHPSAQKLIVPTNGDTKIFALANNNKTIATMNLIQADLMIQNPDIQAVLYTAIPLEAQSASVLAKRLEKHTIPDKPIDPKAAIFVRHLPDRNENQIKANFQPYFGQIKRIVFTSLTTAIIEFDQIVLYKAYPIPLTEKYANVTIHDYRLPKGKSDKVRCITSATKEYGQAMPTQTPKSPNGETAHTLSGNFHAIEPDLEQEKAPRTLCSTESAEKKMALKQLDVSTSAAARPGNQRNSGGHMYSAAKSAEWKMAQMATRSIYLRHPAIAHAEARRLTAAFIGPPARKAAVMQLAIAPQRAHLGPAAPAPFSLPLGTGGMDDIITTGDAPSSIFINQDSADQIRSDWTFTPEGQYVFGSASLDRILQHQNLQCLNNPGRGNCAWFSIIDAGKLHSRFNHVRMLRQHVHDYAVAQPAAVDQLATFLQIPVSDRSAWRHQLLTSIRTMGKDADFSQLHLAAQALQSEIQITDVQTHQVHRIQPHSPGLSPAAPVPVIKIAHRRHNAIPAYDDQFRPIGNSHGHYWAIVPLRRHSARLQQRSRLQLSDFIQSEIPRRRSRDNCSLSQVISQTESDSLPQIADQPGEDHPMDQESHNLPFEQNEELSFEDQQLAITVLEQIELPPICVNWPIGFHFLVKQFKSEELFSNRIRSFRYIHGDVRSLFTDCYTSVLTVLDALPDPQQSPTANFLHRRVISLLTALPALLVSHVPGLGSNAVLDTIKQNCQFFLEAKWSHLYYTACKLNARSNYADPLPPSHPPVIRSDERFFRMVHQLVKGGSLSAAYQRLTQPGLCQSDPLPRFLEIHKDVDLKSLNLHPDVVQDVRDNTNWEEFLDPSRVFQLISKRKNGKASDRHGMRNEFLKILQQDNTFLQLFTRCILRGIAQGLEPFFASHSDSCTGAMLIAPLKPNGLPRPVQIPHMFRAVVTSLAVGSVFKSKEALNFLETGAGRTDPRYSQRGLSKDGCTYVVKETQRILEEANALHPAPLSMDEAASSLSQNGSISPDTVADLKCDITEFFPSGNRQLIFDMLAGYASHDYPHTNIRKGDPMPTHPVFRTVLPLAIALYGRKSLLTCDHPTRPVAFVPFTTGVSQGDGTGAAYASVQAHFAGTQALAQYPNIPVRILTIMDDFHLLGALKYLGPLFHTLSEILFDCVGVKMNLSKSSLNVLQAATIVNPRAALQLVYDECPILADLPLSTEGFVCVGTMDASQCGNDRPGFGVPSITQKLRAINIIRVLNIIKLKLYNII